MPSKRTCSSSASNCSKLMPRRQSCAPKRNYISVFGQALQTEDGVFKQKIEKMANAERMAQREGAEMRSLGKAALKSRPEQRFRDHDAALASEDWSVPQRLRTPQRS